MKATVWCKATYHPKKIESVKVWEGELEIAPPIGSWLSVFDGWGSSRVEELFFDLHNRTMEIQISPDHSGEYAAEMAKRTSPAPGGAGKE